MQDPDNIPGVKQLKNLNLLTQMEVKEGIAILIPRKKGERVEGEEEDSPTNTYRQTGLDRRDSKRSGISGALDNQHGSGKSVTIKEDGRTSGAKSKTSPPGGVSARASPSVAWGAPPIRYKVLK